MQQVRAGSRKPALADDGRTGDPTPFETWSDIPAGSVEGWALVELQWDSFTKPDWFGAGGLTEFDPSRVVGMSFEFGAPGDSRNEGRLWVDDISLSVAGPETTLTPISTAEEAAQGGIAGICGGICPLSALSLPLAALGAIYSRRSKGRRGNRAQRGAAMGALRR